MELAHLSAIKPTSSQRKLTESPEKLNRVQSDFQRSRNIFEGVIRTDVHAKSLLRMVQSSYEDYIQSLENEVEALSKELKSAQEIAVSNQITIRKLESLVTALQTKVQNLKFELDFRIFEAREKAEETPAELSSTREEELNTLKKRIRFCTQLLDFMQAKGLPVVETYREMKFQNKSTRDSNRSQLVSLSDLKPPDESQSHKKPDIPKIVLPPQGDKHPDFQDEFFSKIDEFSESWRREATLTQSRMRADAGCDASPSY